MARAFNVARLLVVFALTILSSATLGLGIALSIPSIGLVPYYSYTVFGLSLDVWWSSPPATRMVIAASGLTLISTVPNIFISLAKTSSWRKFLSVVWIELGWTTVLVGVWLGAAINVIVNTAFPIFNPTTAILQQFESDMTCGSFFGCIAAETLASTSLVIVVLLGGYLITLTACACVTARKHSQPFLTMQVDKILQPEKPLPDVPLDKGEGYPLSYMPAGSALPNYPSHPMVPSLPYASTWPGSAVPSYVLGSPPSSFIIGSSPSNEVPGMAPPNVPHMTPVPLGNFTVSPPYATYAPGPAPTFQPNIMVPPAAGSTLPNNVTYMLVPVPTSPDAFTAPSSHQATGNLSPNRAPYVSLPGTTSPDVVSMSQYAAGSTLLNPASHDLDTLSTPSSPNAFSSLRQVSGST